MDLVLAGDMLMPFSELQRLFHYKSPNSMKNFIRRASDFPKQIRRGDAFNSRIYYIRAEVCEWMRKHGYMAASA